MQKIKYFIFLFMYLTSLCLSENVQIPIEISAEKMEWDKNNSIAIATGSAKAIQGEKIIFADKITADIYNNGDDNEIKKLFAKGNVKFIRSGEVATGKEAIYDLEKEMIIIKGSVTLKKEENIMQGEELSIDFKTGISQIEGTKNKNRVKMKYNAPK